MPREEETGPLPHDTLRIPSRVRKAGDGAPLQMAATLYRSDAAPPAAGWPLVVFNHGSTAAGRRPAGQMLRFETQARYFLARGFAMLCPMRRGRGQSEGEYVEGYDPDPLKLGAGLRHGLDDLGAAIDFMRARPDIDASRMLVAGHSRGGLLSVAFAGQRPAGIVGSINFSGGWIDIKGAAETFTRDVLVRIAAGENGAGGLAAKGPVPSLWLYAENDGVFPPASVRRWHDAYTAAGGAAHLYIFGPLADADGHMLHERPALWQSAADAVLHQLGFRW
jgi:dienelactone hydrolase